MYWNNLICNKSVQHKVSYKELKKNKTKVKKEKQTPITSGQLLRNYIGKQIKHICKIFSKTNLKVTCGKSKNKDNYTRLIFPIARRNAREKLDGDFMRDVGNILGILKLAAINQISQNIY